MTDSENVQSIAKSLQSLAEAAAEIAADLHRLTAWLLTPIGLNPPAWKPPIPNSPHPGSPRGVSPVPPCTIKLVKKSKAKAASPHATAAPGSLLLLDNENSTGTLSGADAAGNSVPLDPTLVTLTVASDTPTVCTATVSGTTVNAVAVAAGSANLTITATWSDGSVGPFTITAPVSVGVGPATGLLITWGTPVVNAPVVPPTP